jgi:hypothetical protein
MKLLLFLAGFIMLVGCTDSTGTSSTAQQQGTPGTPGDPSNPPTPLPPPPPADPSQYPTAEWETTYYEWIDYTVDIHGHIVLSKSWHEPIAIDVTLVDDTAITPTDYNGFYGMSGAKVKSVVFAPGQRIIHLNNWDVAQTHTCGRRFIMKMSAAADAKVFLGPDVPVILKCK